MKMRTAICTLVILLGASSLQAKDAVQQDAQLIDEAFSALNAGNFDRTVEKADLVIKRFEGGKEADSDYVCTNGTTDTLGALLGAAVAKENGRAQKAKTVAVSDNICVAYFLKGFAFVDLHQREKALPNLETAVAMDPDNQHYINELAEWYKSGRLWDKSLELFTRASETTDLSVSTMEDKKLSADILNEMRCRSYRGIAFNHSETGHWAEARAAIEKCLAIVPGDTGSQTELDYIKANSGS